MTSQMSAKIRPISDWQAQLLRITAFYPPDEKVDVSGWWNKIAGEAPESETTKAKESTIIVEGPFKNGKLTLALKPFLVDLRFQLPDGKPNEVGGIPTLGTFDALCSEFVEMSETLLSIVGFPSIQRIAFGSLLALPTKGREQAFEQLASYLKGVQVEPDSFNDFLYQINRKRPSALGVDDLVINRLTKWLVRSYQTIIAPLSVGEQAVSTGVSYGCCLDLDINTHQEYKGCLPKEKINEVLGELVAMGIEIVAHGDIK